MSRVILRGADESRFTDNLRESLPQSKLSRSDEKSYNRLSSLFDLVQANNLHDVVTERDFILSPVEYLHSEVISCMKLIGDRWNSNDPMDFFSIGFDARRKYLEIGLQVYLQLAHTAFALALYGLECSKLRCSLHLGWYLRLNLNYRENFADLLKKIRNICMISSLGDSISKEFVEHRSNTLKYFNGMLSDFNASFNYEECIHYDSLFNEQYLIHFREDTQDYLYALEPPECSDEALEVFRENANYLLDLTRVELKGPSREDIMSWISDSTTFNPKVGFNTSNRTQMREHPDYRGSLTKDFRFNRTIINVAPANTRDSFVSDIDTLYTIKYISFLLKQIISKSEFSAMTMDPVQAVRRKRRIADAGSYIMLDYKKCGLTIPHKLIEILSDLLISKYPQFRECFECMKGFQDAELFVEGVPTRIKRGTGLGNGNEICTLIQCVIATFLKRNKKWDAVVYNDDGVWNFNGQVKRLSFDYILSFVKALGFIPNIRKSFISRYNVFCEEYISPEDKNWEKKQLFFLPVAKLFLQNSIANAKRFLSSLRNALKGTSYNIDAYVMPIIRLYGFECHRFEEYLPSELGGWRDYSPTNFSKSVDFLTRPRDFLKGHETGYARLILQFARFLLSSGKKSLSSFFRTSISYSSKKKMGFLRKEDAHIKIFDSEQEIADFYSFRSNENWIEMDLEALNERGLQNCKPKVRFGLDRKSAFARKRFFRLFWKMKDTIPDDFPIYLAGYAVRLLREGSYIKNFSIPRYYYEINNRTDLLIKKKRFISVFSNKSGKYPDCLLSAELGCHQSQLHLHSTEKLIRGIDIFYFRRRRRIRTAVTLRSRLPQLLPKKTSVADVPREWTLYSQNIRASFADLMTSNQAYIIAKRSLLDPYENLFDRLENLPNKIFDIPAVWKKVILKFRPEQKKILSTLVAQNGADKSDFLFYVQEVEKIPKKVEEPFQGESCDDWISPGEYNDTLFGEEYSVEDMLDLHEHEGIESDEFADDDESTKSRRESFVDSRNEEENEEIHSTRSRSRTPTIDELLEDMEPPEEAGDPDRSDSELEEFRNRESRIVSED